MMDLFLIVAGSQLSYC